MTLAIDVFGTGRSAPRPFVDALVSAALTNPATACRLMTLIGRMRGVPAQDGGSNVLLATPPEDRYGHGGPARSLRARVKSHHRCPDGPSAP
jgi:hypothetical protein